MAFRDDAPVVRREELLWVEVDGELVVYDPDGGIAHLLSSSAAVLWPALTSPVTVDELAADVAAVFDVDEADARQQVLDFCEQMVVAGLLVPVASQDEPS